MATIVQNRISVRFPPAAGGVAPLTDPSSITAVTTHEEDGDALVETLTGSFAKLADGDYFATLGLANYTAGTRYYLKVLFEMAAVPDEVHVHFWIVAPEGAQLPIGLQMKTTLTMGAGP